MATVKIMPWNMLRDAAVRNGGPISEKVRRCLRELAGEMVTEKLLARRFPGSTIRKQVPSVGSKRTLTLKSWPRSKP